MSETQDNVTQKLAEAQKALFAYDKESVKLTQKIYQEYLRLVNDSQKDPNLKNTEGKTAAQLKAEWNETSSARLEGRRALERKIQEVINPALAEQDEDRAKRLLAIQEQSEKACLEKTNTKLAKYRKPELEKAIDEVGGAATKPFKESASFKN